MSERSAGDALETGQNAISIILQPPFVQTGLLPHATTPSPSTHKPPTARDIPPVTLTNIQHVDTAEFEPYLAELSDTYKQLRRGEARELGTADILHGRSADVHPFPAPRRATQGPPTLKTVPAIYFDMDFHLENPRTFDLVIERAEVVSTRPSALDEKNLSANATARGPRKPLTTNAILQEKLSWYIDIVEMHLTSSIAAAAVSLFSALGSLQELDAQAADCVKRIKVLRKELDAVDHGAAINGLHIVQSRQRWGNLQQLQHAIIQLKAIVDGFATCDSLIHSGDLVKASDGISSLEKLISNQPGSSSIPCRSDGQQVQLRDLRGATALHGVQDDLATLRVRLGKAYEKRYLSILLGDLRHYSEAVSRKEVLMRWTGAFVRPRGVSTPESAVLPSYSSSTSSVRTELLEVLSVLYRAKHLETAAVAYREAALKEIRHLVRRPLPGANDADHDSVVSSSTTTGGSRVSQQQKSSILAHNLRALEPSDAEAMLVDIYVNVAETLRRLTTQVKLLLDIASTLDCDVSIAVHPAQELHKAINLPQLLGEAVDLAQDHIVKILRVRSEQSKRLSRAWFLRYFALNLGFVSECESISGGNGTSLKIVVREHIKGFIQHRSETERRILAAGMESDLWVATELSENDAAKLNWILSCSTTDPEEWSDDLKIWIPCSDGHVESDKVGDSKPSDNGKAKRPRAITRSAHVGEQVFVLPISAILCMTGLSHFLQLISGMPSMVADISTSLVSYLSHFNTCCTQLILDAGARQSAGLKNITSKHIALASQALSFIAALTSHIREFVRRHAAGYGVTAFPVVEFDKVKHLLQEHQSRLHDKLVEIMSHLAGLRIRDLRNIDWDDGQKDVHPYMAALAKDTSSLHRILTKIMPRETALVMVPVALSYKVQFSQALQEADFMTEHGRDSMLHDIDLFKSNLGMIDGFGDVGEQLTAIVKAKQSKISAPVSLVAAVEAEQGGSDEEEEEEE